VSYSATEFDSTVSYFLISFFLIFLFFLQNYFLSYEIIFFLTISYFLTDNEIHLYVMSTTNLLILFCVRIEVRRVKRSQFDAVRTMLERCVIRKVVVQSFHSCNNISSNSHNRSTRKINDMSMSVRDEKILLVIRQFRCRV